VRRLKDGTNTRAALSETNFKSKYASERGEQDGIAPWLTRNSSAAPMLKATTPIPNTNFNMKVLGLD
jgi:hypothetical protein